MAAFSGGVAAYQLPNPPSSRPNARSAAIAAAAVGAAAVPADVVRAAAEVSTSLSELLPVGNPNVISDVAAAADAARAAATTARVNVEINLPSITDPAHASRCSPGSPASTTLAGRADTLTARCPKVVDMHDQTLGGADWRPRFARR